jgi:hypothetical protein
MQLTTKVDTHEINCLSSAKIQPSTINADIDHYIESIRLEETPQRRGSGVMANSGILPFTPSVQDRFSLTPFLSPVALGVNRDDLFKTLELPQVLQIVQPLIYE